MQRDLLLLGLLAAGLGAGEQEQALHQPPLLARHLDGAADRGAVVVRAALTRGGQLEDREQRRERRPQLVADVGVEAALAVERFAEPGEQLVEFAHRRQQLASRSAAQMVWASGG